MNTPGVVDLNSRPCIIRQAGDHTWCAKPGCGLSWDTNDPEPPICPTYAVAVQRRSSRELGQAQRRLSALYREPSRRLWGIWPAGVALALAGAYLAWDQGPRFVAWLTQQCAC